MPNFLVSDKQAQDLKALSFGQDTSSVLHPIATDTLGRLIVDDIVNVTESFVQLSIPGIATGTVMQVDTSQLEFNNYSFAVANLAGSAIMNVRIQVSPTSNDSYFIDNSTIALPIASQTFILKSFDYSKFARVLYFSSGPATVQFFFTGHS